MLIAESICADNGDAINVLPRFGGPSSVAADLQPNDGLTAPIYRSNAIECAIYPWFHFKNKLKKDYGLTIGMDYQSLVQKASKSLGDDSAVSGVYRLYGNWIFLNRGTNNTGSLVFKVEHRHRIGQNVVPQDLGFETGAVAITGSLFSDIKLALTNLYWQQKLCNGKFTFVVGQVDVTDYLNIYGLVNPITAFSNLSFQTDASIAAPNQGLGAAFGVYLTEHWYLISGIADANGDPTNPDLNVFNRFETFKHAELGWTSGRDRIYFDNIHLTLWQVDQRHCVKSPRDYGAAFSAAWFIDNHWMPFLRAGLSKGDASLVDASISSGVGYLKQNRDLIGFGLNWGRPSDHSLRQQITLETFYRFQFDKHFAITADLQYIAQPAINTKVSHIIFGGLRGRINI